MAVKLKVQFVRGKNSIKGAKMIKRMEELYCE